MATMVVEIFDALRSIGVAEDKATKAAEAMATLEPQFAVVRQEMHEGFAAVDRQFAGVDRQFATVRSDLRMLTFRVSLIIAVGLGVLGASGSAVWLLIRLASKAGALS